MSRRIPQLFALFCVCIFALTAHAAAVDYFLKIDGVEGESQDRTHKNWIEGITLSGATAHSGGGGGGAGKVCMNDFHFVMKYNKATPKLMTAMSSNRPFAQAVLDARGERHLLRNLRVTAMQPHAMPDGEQAYRVSMVADRCETHAAPALASPAHKHKGEVVLKMPPGPPPIVIGLLLPAVQKVQEAAQPQAPAAATLVALFDERPGVAAILIQDGSPAAALLQRAFRTQQVLEFLEMFRQDQPQEKLRFETVRITSFQTGRSGETPTESLSLNFTKIEFNYSSKTGNTGKFNVKAGYDLKKNEKV